MNIKKYIEYFTTNNKSGYKTRENHIKKNFPDLYKKIYDLEINKDILFFNQKLYNYLYGITEIPNCLTCGNKIKWRGVFTEGYKEYCNLQCGGKGKKRIQNIKKTVLNKYGVDSISKLDSIKNKKIENNLNKYGSEHIFQLESIKDKSKITNVNKYGSEHAIQSNLIKDKRSNNNLNKYGVTNPSKLESVKEKLKKTNLNKYGVDSVMKVDSIKNKINNNKIEEFKIKNNITYDIINISNNNYKIINQCELHNKYDIDINLYYHRVKYGVTNPCIHCNPISKTSSIKENEIKDFIRNELNITNIVENDRKILKSKELDIYIPENKLAIEFDGLYWHSNLNITYNYHLNKTEECNSLGIKLLHIFEDEWVYKSDIIKSIIKTKLDLVENKIYGRKTEIREITSIESRKFLDKNHIQGNVNSKIRIGLFYENELVSLMTFGKMRKVMGSKSEVDEYEMYRFCNKLNTSVIGGASKLFKYFIKKYNPIKIVSYADRRYFDGSLYENLKFTFIGSTKPNFWYFKKNSLKREYRFNYRKDKLISEGYDSTKTANDIMIERGYLRIYDCGNLKFEYNL